MDTKATRSKLFECIWDERKKKVLLAITGCDLNDGLSPEDYKYKLIVSEGKEQREVKFNKPKEKGKSAFSIFPLILYIHPTTLDTGLRIMISSKEVRGEYVFESRLHDVEVGRPLGSTSKIPVYMTKKGKDTGSLQEAWGTITAYAVYSKLPMTRPVSPPTLQFCYKPHLENMKTGDLILYAGTGPGSSLSKCLSGAPFGHIGIVAELANRWTEEAEMYVFELTSNFSRFFDPFKDKADPGVNAFRLRERIHQYWDRGDMWWVRHRSGLEDAQKATLVQWIWNFHQKPSLLNEKYGENLHALQSLLRGAFPDKMKEKPPLIALLDLFSATFAADALRASDVPSLAKLHATTNDVDGRLNPLDLINAMCFRSPVIIRHATGKKPPHFKPSRAISTSTSHASVGRGGDGLSSSSASDGAGGSKQAFGTVSMSSPNLLGSGPRSTKSSRIKNEHRKRSRGSTKERRQKSEKDLVEVMSAGLPRSLSKQSSGGGDDGDKISSPKTPGPAKRRPHLGMLKGGRQTQSMVSLEVPQKSPTKSGAFGSNFMRTGSKRVSRIGKKGSEKKHNKAKTRSPTQDKLTELKWPMCQRVCEASGLKWDAAHLRESVQSLVTGMQAVEGGIPTAEISFKGKQYFNCFLGCDAVDWMTKAFSIDREESVLLGNEILVTGLLYHISRRKGFMDDMELYKFSGNEAEESGYVRDVFGSSLEDIMEAQCALLPDKDVPLIAEVLVEAIKRTGGFEKQGVFRLSTLMTKMDEARSKLNEGDYDSADTYADPHLPASLLKQWLRELAEPVIPETLYEKAIRCEDTRDARRAVVSALPSSHRHLFHYLVDFLVEMSKPVNADRTKMGAENLTTVFTPCLLRCSSDDPIEVMKCMTLETAFIRGVLSDAIESNNNSDTLDGKSDEQEAIEMLRSLSVT